MLIHDLSTAWSRVDPKWASYISLMKEMWEKSGLLSAEDEGAGSGAMARAMERYNREVQSAVPAGQLLRGHRAMAGPCAISLVSGPRMSHFPI